ncbi:MAG TPA: enoyl-CoA hydratase/isomerase family protein [Candidatus Angelobacter sp.]|jgi:enoyl-CoA hydratase|nr:enoyl-CoA hydratase/isomerase family protein [Candidatus Angelobacter sp.]
MGAPVRVELRDGGVLDVTLARPEVRNALDSECFRILGEAFGSRAHEKDVRVVVLRGEGEHFCSGLDRTLLAALAAAPDTEAVRDGSGEGVAWQSALLAVENCPRPTVAVVQGACVGGGVELALACDFRIARADAHFSLMEMRYAFLPDLGGIHRLQRDVGLSRAKEMVYFGGRVEAATLERWGAISEIADADALEVTAQRWAERCRNAAPLAVAAAKKLMQRDPGGSDAEASLHEAIEANVEHLLRSGDFREGLTSAMERRVPQFTGE